ncbi:DUF6115 domain-containing protein [Alteribacter aurantiacus]|uniref:DUF6115 domain-containing protein n=1 Tax=Alteribacter aurantiacus TaxID=254410 RepID=UPI00041994AE|nr:hypothetical protein [Alteribacter aurantiacus]
MEYLLMVSVALHLISFYLIVLLFQRQHKVEAHSNPSTTTKEIEDLLFAYTTEMKENNVSLIKELKKDKEQRQNDDHSPMKEHSKATPTYLPPSPTNNEDHVETSQTAQILSLSERGFKVDEIAKKMNMGKGEVELFLKFYK